MRSLKAWVGCFVVASLLVLCSGCGAGVTNVASSGGSSGASGSSGSGSSGTSGSGSSGSGSSGSGSSGSGSGGSGSSGSGSGGTGSGGTGSGGTGSGGTGSGGSGSGGTGSGGSGSGGSGSSGSGGTTTTITPPSQASAAGFSTLAFDDEFTTANIAPTLSSSSTYNWYPGLAFETKPIDPSQIAFSSDTLTLNWNRTQWESSKRCDTSIESESTAIKGFNLRYGYVEVRMKWDNVVGSWPALWLLPVQGMQGSQQTGEIDMFEGQGLDTHFYGTLHTWNGNTDTWNTNANDRFKTPAGTDYSQWHTYGLLWTPPTGGNPGTITWYLDDVAVGSANTTSSPNSLFDQQNYFLILTDQEGISGQAGGTCHPDTDGSPEDINMSVDWVHVWGS